MGKKSKQDDTNTQNLLIGVLAALLIGGLVYVLVLKDDGSNQQAQYAPQQYPAPGTAAPAAAPAAAPTQAAAVPTATQAQAPAAATPGVNEEGGGTESIVAVYKTYIGENDIYNSSGKKLGDIAAIIQQDRANYHKGEGDLGDEGDPIFANPDMRAKISGMLKRGSVDANARPGMFAGKQPIDVLIVERNGVYEMSVN